jgi:hypothetical protein
VLIRSKYYHGTRYEPPELEIFYAECRECGRTLDVDEIPRDADLEEMDY